MLHPIIYPYANGGNAQKRIDMPFGKRSKRSDAQIKKPGGAPQDHQS
jgi:hypothetical protein